jgi:hypothetical protein
LPSVCLDACPVPATNFGSEVDVDGLQPRVRPKAEFPAGVNSYRAYRLPWPDTGRGWWHR